MDTSERNMHSKARCRGLCFSPIGGHQQIGRNDPEHPINISRAEWEAPPYTLDQVQRYIIHGQTRRLIPLVVWWGVKAMVRQWLMRCWDADTARLEDLPLNVMVPLPGNDSIEHWRKEQKKFNGVRESL